MPGEIRQHSRRLLRDRSTTSITTDPRNGDPRARLFFRHSRLAQAREIRGFVEGADLRHPVVCGALQTSNARITPVKAQSPRFGKFNGGAFGLPSEGICRGEVAVNVR